MRRRTVLVEVGAGPDEAGRFRVFVYGGMGRWTLGEIKAAIAAGYDVRELER